MLQGQKRNDEENWKMKNFKNYEPFSMFATVVVTAIAWCAYYLYFKLTCSFDF